MEYRYVAYDKLGVARLFKQDEDPTKAYSEIRKLMKQFNQKWPWAGKSDEWVIRLEGPVEEVPYPKPSKLFKFIVNGLACRWILPI